jgi:hypothetical protein
MKDTTDTSKLAELIYQSFPDHDVLDLTEEDLESLESLYIASRDCGDSLFRWVVGEILDAYDDIGQMDEQLAIHLLKRGKNDIQRVINAIENHCNI